MIASVDPDNRPLLADTIVVQLAAAVSPNTILYSSTALMNTDGTIAVNFSSFNQNASYYVVVRHRNAMETWSAAPVNFSSCPTNYDFTTSASQAFGSNMKNLGDGNFAFWSGDVSDGTTAGLQDGAIESADYSEIENAVQQFIFAYHVDDVTGDNVVESADYSMIENNVQLFLFV